MVRYELEKALMQGTLTVADLPAAWNAKYKEYLGAVSYQHLDVYKRQVVHLSERYITDRYLPDKAIALLDESCACCNLRHPEITE